MAFNQQNFLRLCTEKQLSASDIAKGISLSPSTVKRWFDGSAVPYPSCCKKLVMILGCEEADIFEEKNVPEALPVKSERKKREKQTKPQSEVIGKSDMENNSGLSANEPAETKGTDRTDAVVVTAPNNKEPMPADSPAAETRLLAEHTKEDYLKIMKDTRFNAKAVTKNMSADEIISWYTEYALNVLSAVTSAVKTSDAALHAVAKSTSVPPRILPLVEAAETASDEGIALAVEILKKVH